MNIVIDINVLISALLFKKSAPAIALDYILDYGNLLNSKETIEELKEVLNRDKFNRYNTQEIRNKFLNKILQHTSIIHIDKEIEKCRDPKDNKFLSLAVSGKADYIVTGDKDLLVLEHIKNIPILTPREFLDSLND